MPRNLNIENQIITGDARKLARRVASGSVDLVFTDPVYERVEDYAWLGEVAMRVLRDDRALLVWGKTALTDQYKQALASAGLRYRWTLHYACSAKGSKPVGGGVFPWVSPCLYFSKGDFTASPYINDWYFSPYSAKQAFRWNKGGGVVEKWLASFSPAGGLVFDPFTGEASVPVAAKRLGRRFIAFEIDEARAETARANVEGAAMYLPYQEAEQLKLVEANI